MCEEIDWEGKKRDWISSVEDLCREIRDWCESEGWIVRQDLKDIEEEHIGSYQLPHLTIEAANLKAHVDPVGLNIVGAEGRVDILAFPSMNSLLLIRKDNSWQLYTDSRVKWPQAWGKDCLFQIINSLSEAS